MALSILKKKLVYFPRKDIPAYRIPAKQTIEQENVRVEHGERKKNYSLGSHGTLRRAHANHHDSYRFCGHTAHVLLIKIVNSVLSRTVDEIAPWKIRNTSDSRKLR